MLCLLYIYIIFAYCHAVQAINCKTPNGEDAQCISIYSCQRFLEAAIKANNETLQFIKQSECGCSMVCCGPSTSLTSKPTTPNVNNKAPNVKFRPLPTRKLCGLQHTDDRFVDNPNGPTAIDEFPWMVQLLYKNNADGTIRDQCAGSLINRRYVLTAAHCLRNSISNTHTVSVRLGEYDKLNDTDCADNPDFPDCSDPVIDMDIEKVIIHPNFKPPRQNNDIALLRMSKNVQFSEFIRPICLPSYGYRNATAGDTLTSSGWGLSEAFGTPARVKKRSASKVITQEECSKRYGNQTRRILIDNTVLCSTTTSTIASCQGDSGAPVMTKTNFQWQQEGIISFGTMCGVGSVDGNTRVSEYVDWIIENIEP